jgi:hypothetical protein
MSNAPSILSGVGNSTQFAEPRTALCEFIAEVRRDLEAGHSRLSSSESVEQLVAAATQTHKALTGHGQTFGEYVQMVRNWQQSAGA